MNIAIIFAGGVGLRMCNNSLPKQFMRVNSIPIIIHTLQVFQNHDEIDKIYISILPSHRQTLVGLLSRYGITKVAGVVDGGETGQDSIYNALVAAAAENPADSVVLVHDGVRPIVLDEVISKNIQGVHEHGSAITCFPTFETILVSENGEHITSIPTRRHVYKAQAPQSFRLGELIACHEALRGTPERYGDLVDSCSVYRKAGKTAHMIMGNYGNIKVTRPEDVFILQGLMRYREATQALGINE